MREGERERETTPFPPPRSHHTPTIDTPTDLQLGCNTDPAPLETFSSPEYSFHPAQTKKLKSEKGLSTALWFSSFPPRRAVVKEKDRNLSPSLASSLQANSLAFVCGEEAAATATAMGDGDGRRWQRSEHKKEKGGDNKAYTSSFLPSLFFGTHSFCHATPWRDAILPTPCTHTHLRRSLISRYPNSVLLFFFYSSSSSSSVYPLTGFEIFLLFFSLLEASFYRTFFSPLGTHLPTASEPGSGMTGGRHGGVCIVKLFFLSLFFLFS